MGWACCAGLVMTEQSGLDRVKSTELGLLVLKCTWWLKRHAASADMHMMAGIACHVTGSDQRSTTLCGCSSPHLQVTC